MPGINLKRARLEDPVNEKTIIKKKTNNNKALHPIWVF